MMATTTKYTFSISSDTSNGVVNSTVLSQELTTSSIVIALDHIETGDDSLNIWFKDVLSQSDQTTLSNVVNAHVGSVTQTLQPITVTLDSPKENDNKPVVTISPATAGFKTWICGADDDPDPVYPDTGRGSGTPFVLNFEPPEVPITKTAEFKFIEPIEVHDGQVVWRNPTNWGIEDYFSLGFRIPSSSLALNTSSLGNCNKVSIGQGMNVIVPANGDGEYDLLEACPIEDTEGSGGYWNVDYNTGVTTPNSEPGNGKFNLFDFEAKGWLIRNVRMTHPMGVFDIDVYKIEYLHNSWRLRWEVTKNTPGSGSVSGWIFGFRRNVT